MAGKCYSALSLPSIYSTAECASWLVVRLKGIIIDTKKGKLNT